MQRLAMTATHIAANRSIERTPIFLVHALNPNQNAALVALHFVAMYLEISIYNGESLVFPYVGSTFIAFMGAALNRSAIKPGHLSVLASVISVVGLSSIIPYFQGNVIIIEFVRSFLQITTSIISAYCLFILIILSSRRRLVKLAAIILIVILAGAFLERFSAVKAFSDGFRSVLYPDSLLYSADYRDIATYGSVRPRFLTREPSIVGIGAGLLIVMIFLLSQAKIGLRVAGAVGTTLICIWVMRSPTIIFFAGIVCYGAIALRRAGNARFSWLLAAALTFALIGTSFLLTYGSGIGGISNRSILGGGSYVIRVFGPPLIWLESLRVNVLFGLGLGSFDALLPIARKI